jgi:dsRNA-specific ribonuclease
MVLNPSYQSGRSDQQREKKIIEEKQIKKWLKGQALDNHTVDYYQQIDANGNYKETKIPGWVEPLKRTPRVIHITPDTLPQVAIKKGIPIFIAETLLSKSTLEPLLKHKSDKEMSTFFSEEIIIFLNKDIEMTIKSLEETNTNPVKKNTILINMLYSSFKQQYNIPDQILKSALKDINIIQLLQSRQNINDFLYNKFINNNNESTIVSSLNYIFDYSNSWRDILTELKDFPLRYYASNILGFSILDNNPESILSVVKYYESIFFNQATLDYIRVIYHSKIHDIDKQKYKEFIAGILEYRGKVDHEIAIRFIENEEAMKEMIFAVTNWSYYLNKYLEKDLNINEKDYEIYEFLGDKSLNYTTPYYAYRRFEKDIGLYGNEQLTEFLKSGVAKKFFYKLSENMGLVNYIRYSEAVFLLDPSNSVKDLQNGDMMAIKITKKVKTDVLESFNGAIELLIDKYIQFGMGSSIVYNIMASLMDELGEPDISININKNKDSISKLKELFEQNQSTNLISYKYHDDKKDLKYEIKDLEYVVKVILSLDFKSGQSITLMEWGEDIQEAKKAVSEKALDLLSKSPYNMKWEWKDDTKKKEVPSASLSLSSNIPYDVIKKGIPSYTSFLLTTKSNISILTPQSIPYDAIKKGVSENIAFSLLNPSILQPLLLRKSNQEIITLLNNNVLVKNDLIFKTYFNETMVQLIRTIYNSKTYDLKGEEYIRYKKFILAILHYRGKMNMNLALKFVDNGMIMQELLYAVTNWSYYLSKYAGNETPKDEQDYETYEFLGDKSLNHDTAYYAYRRFEKDLGLYGNEQLTEFLKSGISRKFFYKLCENMGLVEFIRYTSSVILLEKPNTISGNNLIDIKITKKMKTDVFEGFNGAIEFLIDKHIQFGLGSSVVYNIMSSLLDEFGEDELSIDIHKNKDSVSKIKEIFEQQPDVVDPYFKLKDQLIKGGIEEDVVDNMINELSSQYDPQTLKQQYNFNSTLYNLFMKYNKDLKQRAKFNQINKNLNTLIIETKKLDSYSFHDDKRELVYDIQDMEYQVQVTLTIDFNSGNNKPQIKITESDEDIQEAKKKAADKALEILAKPPYNLKWNWKEE